MEPKVYTPKTQIDEDGYDQNGVLHDKCGTPECCKKCDTPDTQEDKQDGGI